MDPFQNRLCKQIACWDIRLFSSAPIGTSVSDEAVSLMRDTSRCRLDTADLSLAHLRTDVDSLEIGELTQTKSMALEQRNMNIIRVLLERQVYWLCYYVPP